jgi:hypothetical protein
MVNIFEKITIPTYFFDSISITTDLLNYLYDNLENENYNLFRWDLRNALTINANGKYIF